MHRTKGWTASLIGLLSLTVLLWAYPQPAGAQSASACWDLAYAAIRHRAAAPHPPFILYDETQAIVRDGLPLMSARASIAYRDDGVARISDERFSFKPYVSRFMEPGPPELGPYGGRRSIWLTIQGLDQSLPLIGEVRSNNGLTCTNEGVERYKDHSAYHLSFTTQGKARPALRTLLVDTAKSEIWKVVLSQYLPLPGTSIAAPPLVTFEIELQEANQYLVVQHVTWKYEFREYSQWSTLFGEYYYSDFQFPAQMPVTLFQD
ncbi:MAG: hypothetical protein M3N19_11050 [Candidatus Eremiobacteraeota bacterium]|nr:hypothetical protein [Candidatus Eremiobacteraeota bacterium]